MSAMLAAIGDGDEVTTVKSEGETSPASDGETSDELVSEEVVCV